MFRLAPLPAQAPLLLRALHGPSPLASTELAKIRLILTEHHTPEPEFLLDINPVSFSHDSLPSSSSPSSPSSPCVLPPLVTQSKKLLLPFTSTALAQVNNPFSPS
ncbi:hypothetical protein CGMCC3_g6755 [Colletotrichum fructicola]|uniref:Uncharacterized protein n=1 Tax=Colletotrichum fructicola (strain Nara gc5) TaxID=1213859 RepID=A0A7J6IT06_COLFN|nr:uncharacterized protein CGMCC3_g6755 [Colletotrichum fructicola]KAE9577133.1 hypothetical protein CGMCC3_g6755 [Colletotrichum fructicola]KAF4479551.1 hypothetical protein CGGC5_v012435 [Colletotrichum fructicola Nara gc5]